MIGKTPLKEENHLLWDDIIKDIMTWCQHFEVLQKEHELVRKVMANVERVRVKLENKPGFSQSAIDYINSQS